MSNLLKNLKLVPAPGRSDPVVSQRQKLVTKLEEQAALLANPKFVRVERRRKDGQVVEVEKKIRPSWVVKGDGSAILTVKHAGKSLELKPGLSGVSVESVKELPGAIELLIEATRAGELDQVLEQASRATKSRTKAPPKAARSGRGSTAAAH
jgi:hypothetical protein